MGFKLRTCAPGSIAVVLLLTLIELATAWHYTLPSRWGSPPAASGIGRSGRLLVLFPLGALKLLQGSLNRCQFICGYFPKLCHGFVDVCFQLIDILFIAFRG